MSANLPAENPPEQAEKPSSDTPATSESPAEMPAETPAETPAGASLDDGARPAARRGGMAPSRLSLVLVAVLAGSALFVGGYTLGSHVASTPGTPASEEARFGSFWDVYNLIQSDFAGSPKPSEDQLVQGAIKGMLESLNDPWSFYQAPQDFTSSLQDVGGQAQGIGVVLQLQPVDASSTQNCQAIGGGCELAVVSVIDGSPAQGAGVQAGDVFSAVDGQSLDGKTVDQAIALIKGDVGTKVTIVFLRNGEPVTLTITRAVYNRPEVTYKSLAAGSVAYIKIAENINEPAASQFDAALQKALAAGQKDVIVDLRGNLGGYVDSAEKIASEFIPDGVLVYQQDASGTTSAVDASPGGRATDPSIKVVVLVDGNTASASEIIAAAIQARDRGVLVGTKTYGKGVVQAWLPLPDNFGGIHLTIARWLTPDKVWIQGQGLQPDIPVDTSPVDGDGTGGQPEPCGEPEPCGDGTGGQPEPCGELTAPRPVGRRTKAGPKARFRSASFTTREGTGL
jgi:carboxyl-terminal processing protease